MVELSPQLIDAARNILGESNMICTSEAKEPFLSEWRDRWHGSTPMIALPSDVEQVSKLVKLCAKHRVCITTQGGNTGLVGGQIPQGEILLCTRNLKQVLIVDKKTMTMTASAGISLQMAAEAAAKHDLLFALELASGGSATIGGAISTNAGGMAVLRYGTMRNMVLGLEVVLANGETLDGLQALYKDNTGYDLKQVFIGAEGTLGVITAASLRLFPMPKAKTISWCAVNSVQKAADLLAHLQANPTFPIAKFELISKLAIDLVVERIPGSRAPLNTRTPWSVLIEFESEADRAETALAEVLERGFITDAVIANSEAQAQTLLALRENISAAQKGAGGAIKHDISLPLSVIPKFLLQAKKEVLRLIPDTRFCVFGHLGDGNLHYNLLSPLQMNPEEFTGYRDKITRIIHDLVHEMNGSFSAEHGIGIAKIADLKRYKSTTEIMLMRRLKQTLDQDNLMNPRLWFEPDD